MWDVVILLTVSGDDGGSGDATGVDDDEAVMTPPSRPLNILCGPFILS